MEHFNTAKYFLIVLLLIFFSLAFLTILPLIKSLTLACVLAFAFYPVYKWFLKKTKSKNLSATIMLLMVTLLIIIPTVFIVNSLVSQTYSTYSFVQTIDFNSIEEYLPVLFDNVNVDSYISELMFNIRNYILNAGPNFIGSIAQTILGLFIMFFVLFYAFRDGKEWVTMLKENLPLKKEYADKLFANTANITGGVIYGYVLTAVIQGILGGLAFLILGLKNPVFWGFVMMILAAIPFLGTPIVWLPAALIQIFTGHYVTGIILLVFGFVILINIDNIIRPKLISGKTKVHPAVVLVGVFGGLSIFGFIGILMGPLILSLFAEIVRFFVKEFKY